MYEEYVQEGDDEKIERFRVIFWKRRDPTPETPRNEFREEYLRRISEAEHVFIEGRKLGWRTDRGKVFLLLGPPDKFWQKSRSGSGTSPDEMEGSQGRSSQSRTAGGRASSEQSLLTWFYKDPPVEGFRSSLEIRFLQQPGTPIFKLTSRIDFSSLRLKGLKNNDLRVTEDGLAIEGMPEITVADSAAEKGVPLTPLKITSARAGLRSLLASGKAKILQNTPSFSESDLALDYETVFLKSKGENTLVTVNVRLSDISEPRGVHIYAWLRGPKGIDAGAADRGVERASDDPLIYALEKDRIFDLNTNLSGDIHVYQAGTAVPPGLYDFALLAVARDQELFDQVESTIEVPDYQDGRLALSTIILAQNIARVQESIQETFFIGRFRVDPRVDSTFVEGSQDDLNVFFRVYNWQKEPDGSSNLTIRYTFLRQEDGDWRETPLNHIQENARGDAFGIPFTVINRLQGGRYKLRVIVEDNTSGQTAEGFLPFEKVQSGG